MTPYVGGFILVGLFVGFFAWLGWTSGKRGEQIKREQMTAFALKEEKEMKEHEAKLYSGPSRPLAAITDRLRKGRRD